MKHYVAPGKALPAMGVNSDTAVGLVTLNQLEHFGIKSPWLMAKTSRSKMDEQDQPFKTLREVIQRAWDKARDKRADLYSTYIENVLKGTVEGGTPPVTIFVSHAGTENDSEISFPYTSTAIALDGETQLEGRFRLRGRDADTGDIPFPVTIYHGCSEQKAMQILHDFNHFAKPIPESKLGMRNAAGGISQTVETALDLVPGATLNSGQFGTKKHAAGFSQTMFFVVGYAVGQAALDKTGSVWFDALNMPGAPPVNGNCAAMLGDLISMAQIDPKLRGTAAYLWQVAGVLAHEGRAPRTLNWDAGIAAYKAAPNVGQGGGQGGNRGKTAERLHAIYDAMK
jgi:hypothetical protein